MNLKECHNPVFDFTLWPINESEYDFGLKYKGQPLDITDAEYDSDSFKLSFDTPPDEFLNFDASHYFNGLELSFTFEPHVIKNLCGIVELTKAENCIIINYFLYMDEDDSLPMKYNPIRLIKTIRENLNKKGMKLRWEEAFDYEHWFLLDLAYEVPPHGNLAAHYHTGISLLNELYIEVIDEIKQLKD